MKVCFLCLNINIVPIQTDKMYRFLFHKLARMVIPTLQFVLFLKLFYNFYDVFKINIRSHNIILVVIYGRRTFSFKFEICSDVSAKSPNGNRVIVLVDFLSRLRAAAEVIRWQESVCEYACAHA